MNDPRKISDVLGNLSIGQKKLINAAVNAQLEHPAELGFVCRAMVSASMPHSKVKGLQFNRENNKFKLTIIGNEAAGGIPYGTYPRLILSWLSGEIIKSKSREVILGESLSDFMKKLGLSVSGGRWGTISRFKDQMKMLFSATISCSYENPETGEWLMTHMNIADKAQIFWDPYQPDQIDLFKSKITLGQVFYEEVSKSPIPVNIPAINALKNSSLALDIYFWLTHRMSYLKKPILIPFSKLQEQFGVGYENTPHGRYEFRRKFLHQLKNVQVIYPRAKVFLKDEGLLVYPSPTHVTLIQSK